MSTSRKHPVHDLAPTPQQPNPAPDAAPYPGDPGATDRAELLDRRAGMLAAVLVCASAVLSGLLDVLLVPVYVGATPLPVAVAAAVVGNIVLPALAVSATGRPGAGIAALACWFLPVVALSMYLRPEGDVIVLAEHSQEYIFYGVLLAGVVTGIATVVWLGRRASARR